MNREWRLDGFRKTQVYASKEVQRALRNGTLTRPAQCELCGRRPGEETKHKLVVAHHARGYDHPLDVWWLCSRCNGRLAGPIFHCGRISRAEARHLLTHVAGGRRLTEADVGELLAWVPD